MPHRVRHSHVGDASRPAVQAVPVSVGRRRGRAGGRLRRVARHERARPTVVPGARLGRRHHRRRRRRTRRRDGLLLVEVRGADGAVGLPRHAVLATGRCVGRGSGEKNLSETLNLIFKLN